MSSCVNYLGGCQGRANTPDGHCQDCVVGSPLKLEVVSIELISVQSLTRRRPIALTSQQSPDNRQRAAVSTSLLVPVSEELGKDRESGAFP